VNPYKEHIGSLKRRLAEKAAKNQQDEQRSTLTTDTVWIWNAKVLDDDEYCLGDYGLITSNSHIVIHVSPRNPGGCFMVSLTVLCIIFMAIIGSTCTCGLSLVLVPLLLPLLFILPLFCL